MKSILGRKAGMTQVFTTDGVMVPVTVIEVLPNVVLQKKTIEKDGYEALQVGYEEKRENITTKPLIVVNSHGHMDHSCGNYQFDKVYIDKRDLELVKKHKHVFKLIHNKPYLFGNEKASKDLYNELFEKILDSYGVKEEDKEYVFAYYTQGTLAIVLKWIEKDCLDSIERVSELIINMINHKE